MACEIWLLFLTVTTHFAFVTSQYVDSFCSNKNYTKDSLFRANLHILLGSLSSSTGNVGFYNASVGEANAIALCRADMELHACRGCINIASEDLLLRCPDQFEGILWQQYCMVRYSNEPMFGILDTDPTISKPSAANVTNPELQFIEVLEKLMHDLGAEAANGGALRKAAAGNRSASANRTIYAMLQCTPDLSPENCTSCLARAAPYIRGSPGFRMYTPSCTVRYEDAEFYNITRLQEPLESSPGNDDNRTRNIIIIVASIVGLLTIAFCVGIFARKGIKQKIKGDPQFGEDGDEISAVESIQYDFGKIKAATNDFSDANKLGQGGFGAVYKGKFKNGREIAVKRLSRDSGQGDVEFKNEVLLVAKLQHRNLARLMGLSMQGIERLLVYEFVQNGSLDHFLFDRIKSSNLDWDIRYRIIGGVARGLLYLHQDSRLRIIHRDLKASNVLLDEEMNPKISDFGLAKIVLPDATQESTSRIVGTYGYMAPEYAFHGHFSIKSDVYSFGVLVLEIVTGQKKIFLQNGQNSGDLLLSHAWRSWREGTSTHLIDPVLMANSGGSQQDMLRCIHIALLCVQQNPDERPTMASVVLMLNSFSLTLPLPLEPGFYFSNTSSEASLSQAQENYSYRMVRNRSSNGLLADQPVHSSGNVSSITHLYAR